MVLEQFENKNRVWKINEMLFWSYKISKDSNRNNKFEKWLFTKLMHKISIAFLY